MQGKGLSPVCVRIWTLSTDFRVKDFPHLGNKNTVPSALLLALEWSLLIMDGANVFDKVAFLTKSPAAVVTVTDKCTWCRFWQLQQINFKLTIFGAGVSSRMERKRPLWFEELSTPLYPWRCYKENSMVQGREQIHQLRIAYDMSKALQSIVSFYTSMYSIFVTGCLSPQTGNTSLHLLPPVSWTRTAAQWALVEVGPIVWLRNATP